MLPAPTFTSLRGRLAYWLVHWLACSRRLLQAVVCAALLQHAARHPNGERFVQSLRSAVVMVNASSRFSDGGELGLGAEIGISTTRLHAYGPMGLEALTVERFVVRGEGQVRHPGLVPKA